MFEWAVGIGSGVVTIAAGVVALVNYLKKRRKPQDREVFSPPFVPAAVNAPRASPRNLPIPLSTFVARDTEIDQATRLLESDTCRLVTLTGPGGIGKTRLALAVSQAAQSKFVDGVHFVDLAAIKEPDLVLPTIARSLGLRETEGHRLIDDIGAALQGQIVLLVIDNFEQVVSASPVVKELLEVCQTAKALVTSREALNLPGEMVYEVPPLRLPSASELATTDNASHFGAIALFIDRARQSRPSFTPSRSEMSAIVEICTRLDGLPLAIELAAARIRFLTAQELLRNLKSYGLRVLEGTHRGPERHRTLSDTITWSYDLLSTDSQRVFRNSSTFLGGFTSDAVAHVCDMPNDIVLLNIMSGLVDQSLFRLSYEGGDGQRFMMLETIRAFGNDRLMEQVNNSTIHEAHAAYFTAYAETTAPQQRGRQAAEVIEQLETEYGNLRSALTWARDSMNAELGLRLAGALWYFWELRGYFSEGRNWIHEFLSLPNAHEVPTIIRARALTGAGALARVQGDWESAAELISRGLSLFRNEQNLTGIAWALNNAGDLDTALGNHLDASRHYEESLNLRLSLNDHTGIAWLIHNLGNIAKDKLDSDEALRQYEEAWRWIQTHEVVDSQCIAMCLSSLAGVLLEKGNAQRAHSLLLDSLAYFDNIHDTQGIAHALEGLALAAEGEPARASKLWGASQRLRQASSVVKSPSQLLDHERSMALARESLGDMEYEACWASGWAMTEEEAIQFARDKLA